MDPGPADTIGPEVVDLSSVDVYVPGESSSGYASLSVGSP